MQILGKNQLFHQVPRVLLQVYLHRAAHVQAVARVPVLYQVLQAVQVHRFHPVVVQVQEVSRVVVHLQVLQV